MSYLPDVTKPLGKHERIGRHEESQRPFQIYLTVNRTLTDPEIDRIKHEFRSAYLPSGSVTVKSEQPSKSFWESFWEKFDNTRGEK